MSGFPLYDNLILKLPTKDLTIKQKDEYNKICLKIDNNGTELIYALVHFFFRQNDTRIEGDIDVLPYSGSKKEVNKGVYDITWNLMSFPIKLRQLLYKFVILHLKKIEEDNTRN